jgi:cell division protein FtsB
VKSISSAGFKTVEHIRDMDDHAIQRIGMGGRNLKQAAEVFLDDASRIALTSQLSAENDRLNGEVVALRRQVEEMGKLTSQTFAELQSMKNAPNPLAVTIPGMSDPVELAKIGQHQPLASSSLDNIGTRRKGGRPALPRDDEGNIIRSA